MPRLSRRVPTGMPAWQPVGESVYEEWLEAGGCAFAERERVPSLSQHSQAPTQAAGGTAKENPNGLLNRIEPVHGWPLSSPDVSSSDCLSLDGTILTKQSPTLPNRKVEPLRTLCGGASSASVAGSDAEAAMACAQKSMALDDMDLSWICDVLTAGADRSQVFFSVDVCCAWSLCSWKRG